MKIISERKYITETHYEIVFKYADRLTSSCFVFSCDKDGKIDLEALKKKPAGYANYLKCLSGEHSVLPGEFQSWKNSYTEPAIGECSCGCEVVLDSFTNTCDGCERDYNMSGQELAPRSQWGEETGESYCDLQDL